ncbi:INO80-BINDING PROTEIN 2B [Hibiscus trionum]|uniref:INO80-BINDING PROTEIN 2B n=1 Tax=Hibiscus trionum TaxID=183268 RepID=A0A9W7IDM1_HIBTR|nr:INO80-BINDING PROTEIN 2B [Hibiscus trionum]
MKRASRNSHRQYNNNSVDEEARATIKHQNLLHDFLELRKEFVSKKKNLETINQMRGTLLNEIRFLRQRYNYLSMIKSQEYELQQDSVQSQNPYPQSKRTKKHGVSESIERRLSSLPDSYPNVVHEEEGGRSHVDVQAVSRKGKKPQRCLINGKRVGKRKISWQDQVALKV